MSHASSSGRFVSKSELSSCRQVKTRRRFTSRGLFLNNCPPRFLRLVVEQLEDRRVLTGDQWVMAFRALTLGATPEEQMQAGQAFLQDHGISDIQIVAALDLEGTFLIEAAEDTTDESLQDELQPLPGFAIAEEYFPEQAPSGSFDPGPP